VAVTEYRKGLVELLRRELGLLWLSWDVPAKWLNRLTGSQVGTGPGKNVKVVRKGQQTVKFSGLNPENWPAGTKTGSFLVRFLGGAVFYSLKIRPLG